jgi:hypothetical protein
METNKSLALQNFCGETSWRSDHLQDIKASGRYTLRWILEK